MKRNAAVISVVVAFSFLASVLYAATQSGAGIQALMDSYLVAAKKADPGFKGFSAEDGKAFFNSRHIHSEKKEERSCAKCHTSDPTQKGKTTVGKVIEPMAVSVNKDRFTDPQKVEKWFKRNCSWVHERECTPKEKGNFLTYMISI